MNRMYVINNNGDKKLVKEYDHEGRQHFAGIDLYSIMTNMDNIHIKMNSLRGKNKEKLSMMSLYVVQPNNREEIILAAGYLNIPALYILNMISEYTLLSPETLITENVLFELESMKKQKETYYDICIFPDLTVSVSFEDASFHSTLNWNWIDFLCERSDMDDSLYAGF